MAEEDKRSLDGPFALGTLAKIDMYKNSVVTIDSIVRGDKAVTDDTRLIDLNMLTLPIDVNVGDYIDIRLSLANGQDFIVASKKEVINLFGNTISLNLKEFKSFAHT